MKDLSGENSPNPKNRDLRRDALANMRRTPGFLLCAQDVKINFLDFGKNNWFE